jgi:glycosyltransferase involved in cell wall biosynthesis
MTEKTTLTDAQLRCCALAHETWVPTEWHRAVYRRAGCGDGGRVAKIRALPEAVDEAVFAPTPRGPGEDPEEGPEGAANANLNAKTPTTFLSVFQWQRRKGPDALLEAYWRAFGASDDVLLVIRAKVPRWAGEPFATARDGVRYHAKRLYPGKALSDLAPVETVEDLDSTRLEMAALYRAADAFALATRGEGWCLPCAEAMSSGALLIASDFSGVTAYADASNSLPVRCPPARGGSDLGGCDPDAEGLAWRMRWTHEHRADAAALARRGAEDVRRRFGLEAVGGTWRGEIARVVGEAARGRGGERRRGNAGLTDADDDG